MNGSALSPIKTHFIWVEVALVFLVFCIQGSSPVPDVNEPYYLSKAIHFWNNEWIPNDFFLNSADTHKVFYFTFGWLALFLSPTACAWAGRLLTWALLAWAWQRLSYTLVPRRGWSVLTASLLVCLIARFHMAGEWLIGGVEAKGFAYVLILLGLDALLRNRWNRTWLYLGGAALFHVLVGGWAVVAAGIAWLVLKDDRPTLRSMMPALLGGFLLSLPGLIPSLMLDWGVDAPTVNLAHRIYVYKRLAHHLAPTLFHSWFVVRFSLLMLVWLVLYRQTRTNLTLRRLQAFVFGTIVICLGGTLWGIATLGNQELGASLLRFYWFRLSDIFVPVGVVLGGAVTISWALQKSPAIGNRWLGAALAIAMVHVGSLAMLRPFPIVPPADRYRVRHYIAWRQACNWIAWPGNVPAKARFLTPRMAQTFKWYTGRSEVVTWKDIPQDAKSVVQWWRRMQDIHGTGGTVSGEPWHGALSELSAERITQLGKKYDAQYALIRNNPQAPLDLKIVYRNRRYSVYQLSDE